jgi:hypothetical protein
MGNTRLRNILRPLGMESHDIFHGSKAIKPVIRQELIKERVDRGIRKKNMEDTDITIISDLHNP